MTNATPLNTKTYTEGPPAGCAELVPPPSPQNAEPSGQGVGVGVGTAPPGKLVPPPSCPSEMKASAHTKSADASKRLIIEVSPCVEVVKSGGIASARTSEYTPPCLSDLELYKQFMRWMDFEGALTLCRERLFAARDERTSVLWTKEAAIVENARHRPQDALDRLASVHFLASKLDGTLRGKYDNELGRAHELLGEFMAAFRLYKDARGFLVQCGAIKDAAGVDNNTARAYTFAGRPESSFFYLDRASEVAKQHSDVLLLGEVEESRALALEAQGQLEEAEKAAAHSVYLLTGTGEEAALMESRETYERLFSLRKLRKAGR